MFNPNLLDWTNELSVRRTTRIDNSSELTFIWLTWIQNWIKENRNFRVYYDSVVVKSIRPIKPGEEVTICYSEVDALLTLPERQIITEEIFYFTCKCYFCEYERNWVMAGSRFVVYRFENVYVSAGGGPLQMSSMRRRRGQKDRSGE